MLMRRGKAVRASGVREPARRRELADYNEINGWPSLGFAFTWALPPISPKRPTHR